MYAVGMCGQGYMLGPGLGQLLVRIAQEKSHPEDQVMLYNLRPNRQFVGQEKLR